MLVSEILYTLPAPLEWMVLFNLSAIRPMANDEIIKAMYHLPAEIDLSPYSHVVLANSGHFLASASASRLVEVTSGRGWTRERIRHSLYDRYADRLALLPIDEADCLGLGQSGDYSPVLLQVKIEAGCGHAQAIFAQEPSREHYELLQAVGVKFLGGTQQGDYYLAQFQNRLPVHIHAGILSHFSRTAHCNLFFLQHGNIDPPLEAGLVKASEVRITWARQRSAAALAALAQEACQRSMPMICQPPQPQPPFAYGDLVPLGFVLSALHIASTSAMPQAAGASDAVEVLKNTHQTLSQFLLNQQQNHLWAFHTDRLVTATDSALVLQGFRQSGLHQPETLSAVKALEAFADGKGGYYPQLWSGEQQPGKMVFDESCRHWCQSDYATTCLVRALVQAAGLPSQTSTDALAAAMANRSGLYFANPYLVDWALALAIGPDQAAASLRQQLLTEVLASMNQDYSFGTYDIALSTALAILTLSTLGYRGRILRAAQLRLLECMDTQGRYPTSIPFYSSLRIDHEVSTSDLLQLSLINAFSARNSGQRQIRLIHNQSYSISLYQDTHCFISTALAVLALSEPCLPTQPDLQLKDNQPSEAHARYRCANHCEYIAKFALPPYITAGKGKSAGEGEPVGKGEAAGREPIGGEPAVEALRSWVN